MRTYTLALAAGLALAGAGCSTLGENQTMADYCAMPAHSTEKVCLLKVEIDGNSTAIADTKMSVRDARELAEVALTSAEEANAAAADARAVANEALSRANQALASGDLECETRTINNSSIGTCSPGYTLVGCTQTRYTTRAGGLSFLRELSDEQCRFNSRVLEMDVRCCRAADRSGETANYSKAPLGSD